MSEWDKNTGVVDAPFKMVCILSHPHVVVNAFVMLRPYFHRNHTYSRLFRTACVGLILVHSNSGYRTWRFVYITVFYVSCCLFATAQWQLEATVKITRHRLKFDRRIKFPIFFFLLFSVQHWAEQHFRWISLCRRSATIRMCIFLLHHNIIFRIYLMIEYIEYWTYPRMPNISISMI